MDHDGDVIRIVEGRGHELFGKSVPTFPDHA
jgi:hypothetical protein